MEEGGLASEDEAVHPEPEGWQQGQQQQPDRKQPQVTNDCEDSQIQGR